MKRRIFQFDEWRPPRCRVRVVWSHCSLFSTSEEFDSRAVWAPGSSLPPWRTGSRYSSLWKTAWGEEEGGGGEETRGDKEKTGDQEEEGEEEDRVRLVISTQTLIQPNEWKHWCCCRNTQTATRSWKHGPTSQRRTANHVDAVNVLNME